MGIVSWMLLGLLVGALAKWVLPGRDRGGCIVTMLLGVLGAVLGGFIGTRLGMGDVRGFDLRSLGLALVGALAVVIVFRLIFGTRKDES